MKTTSHLIDIYTRAAKKFQTAEAALVPALDALATARATDADVTAEYRRAERADRECDEAWNAREQARRAYWAHRAKLAESDLERLALPLVALIKHCHQAARVGLSASTYSTLTRIAGMDLPAVVSEEPIPAAGADSAALDRAEWDLYNHGRL